MSNKVGRPLKFKSVEELEFAPDGDIIFVGNKIFSNDFKKEQDLQNYIIKNIESFTKDVLDDELIEFKSEMPIYKKLRMGPRGRTIDLYIKGKKNIYIIELKNPKYQSENRAGIGQILDYGREFLDSHKKLVLITTRFDIHTMKTIDYYNLPIDYIYMDKKRVVRYKGELQDD